MNYQSLASTDGPTGPGTITVYVTNASFNFTQGTVYIGSNLTLKEADGSSCNTTECTLHLNTTIGTLSGNTTLDNTMKSESFQWEVLFLVPLVLFGATGNILVCMAVSMEKRLQTVTNFFLFSLAITDLLVCLVVMPLSIIHHFLGYWPFNAVLCDIFVTSDVLMCTSSILHLCTISLERFIAIRSPLASRKRSKGTVFVKLGFVWLGSIAISSPIMILGFIDSNNIMNNNQCVLRNKEFIIYGSICAFFIPLGIMVIIYGLTVRLLRKQSMLYDPKRVSNGQPTIRRSKSRRKRCRDHSQTPHISLQMDSRSPSPVDYDDKRSCSMSLSEFDTSLNQINSLNIPGSEPRSRDTSTESLVTVHYDMDKNYSHNGFLTVPRVASPRMSSTESLITSDNDNDNSTDEDSNQNIKQYLTDNETRTTRMKIYFKKQLIVKASSILQMNKDPTKVRDDKTLVRTEQKASKVLGMVFFIFVICWAPFFIVNIMTVLCRQCYFQPVLILIFVWLGYISSTLNPIIYTMFNSTFKMTFVKLLKCQYGFLLRPLRRKAWSATHTNHTTASSDSNAEIPL